MAAAKKTTRKKAAAKSKGRTTATKSTGTGRPRSRKKNVRKGASPLSVLTIMALATAVVVLINNYKKGNISIGSVLPENRKNKTNIDKKTTARKFVRVKNDGDTEKESFEAKEKIDKSRPTQYKEVKLYFIKLNETTEKVYLTIVKRKVESDKLLENTIKQLLKGPYHSEKKRGMLTAVSGDIRLRKAYINKRTAVLDFNSAIAYRAAGNILIRRLDQIVYTATQFKDVDNVVLKINGKRRQTLGSDGLAIGGPLHRRE